MTIIHHHQRVSSGQPASASSPQFSSSGCLGKESLGTSYHLTINVKALKVTHSTEPNQGISTTGGLA